MAGRVYKGSYFTLRKALVDTPLQWVPHREGALLICLRPNDTSAYPSIHRYTGRWELTWQRSESGWLRHWLLGNAVRAWERAYIQKSKFLLTADEERLLQEELPSEDRLMAQFAELEAREQQRQQKIVNAPVIAGLERGIKKGLSKP